MGVKSATSKPKQVIHKPANKTQQTNKAQTNNKVADAKDSDNAQKANKVDANNHDMQSKSLSEREKEIQQSISEGNDSVDVKEGDKVGNYARAISDKDSNGELNDYEMKSLQANTKAVLDKNPDLVKLAKENGLDPNNPADLDAIMQLKADEASLVAGKDKVALPGQAEEAKAQEEINQNNEELPPPAESGEAEEAKGGGGGGKCGGGGGCDKAGGAQDAKAAEDAASDISRLVQEGYAALQKGDYATATQKFTQAINVGIQQLGTELNAGDNKAGVCGAKSTPQSQKLASSLNPAQQQSALQSLVKSDVSGTVQAAMAKASGNEKIQNLLNLIAYAQKGLEHAQAKGKNDVKKQTGGDPNAQQALLSLNNKPQIPQFKAA